MATDVRNTNFHLVSLYEDKAYKKQYEDNNYTRNDYESWERSGKFDEISHTPDPDGYLDYLSSK